MTIAPQGSSTQPFQYTGEQRDGNGLIYLRARYDDPTTGRFLSRDALTGAILVPLSLNRLIYARDNPVLVTDPSGRCGSWFSPIPDDYECLAIDPALQYGEDQLAGGTGENEIRLQQAETPTGDSGSNGAAGAKGPESTAISQTLKASYIHKGIKVYRVWGGGSGPWGRSWTTVDPRTVPSYRDVAGLPNQNSGRFVSEGILVDTEGVTVTSATPLHGDSGGMVEIVIPDPVNQVQLRRVSGVNPEY